MTAMVTNIRMFERENRGALSAFSVRPAAPEIRICGSLILVWSIALHIEGVVTLVPGGTK